MPLVSPSKSTRRTVSSDTDTVNFVQQYVERFKEVEAAQVAAKEQRFIASLMTTSEEQALVGELARIPEMLRAAREEYVAVSEREFKLHNRLTRTQDDYELDNTQLHRSIAKCHVDLVRGAAAMVEPAATAQLQEEYNTGPGTAYHDALMAEIHDRLARKLRVLGALRRASRGMGPYIGDARRTLRTVPRRVYNVVDRIEAANAVQRTCVNFNRAWEAGRDDVCEQLAADMSDEVSLDELQRKDATAFTVSTFTTQLEQIAKDTARSRQKHVLYRRKMGRKALDLIATIPNRDPYPEILTEAAERKALELTRQAQAQAQEVAAVGGLEAAPEEARTHHRPSLSIVASES